jgi:hypothetical protein
MEVGALFTVSASNVAGDVYMGVGPGELTYIASIRPRMAFIVDIRRRRSCSI